MPWPRRPHPVEEPGDGELGRRHPVPGPGVEGDRGTDHGLAPGGPREDRNDDEGGRGFAAASVARVRRSRLTVLPSAFVAVTVTTTPARSRSVSIDRRPVAASTATPSPATAKLSREAAKSWDRPRKTLLKSGEKGNRPAPDGTGETPSVPDVGPGGRRRPSRVSSRSPSERAAIAELPQANDGGSRGPGGEHARHPERQERPGGDGGEGHLGAALHAHPEVAGAADVERPGDAGEVGPVGGTSLPPPVRAER